MEKGWRQGITLYNPVWVWRFLLGPVAERDGDINAVNRSIPFTVGKKTADVHRKSLKMLRVAKANLFEASMMLRFKAAVAVWLEFFKKDGLSNEKSWRNKENAFLETEADL